MTVSVLVEGILKDELVDEFVQICKGAYSVTRAYDGCQSITLNLNVDNRNNFVMTEVWDSKEHYEKYLAGRRRPRSQRVLYRRVRRASAHRTENPGVDCRLRLSWVRHRGDHGRAGGR